MDDLALFLTSIVGGAVVAYIADILINLKGEK